MKNKLINNYLNVNRFKLSNHKLNLAVKISEKYKFIDVITKILPKTKLTQRRLIVREISFLPVR